MLVEFEPEVQSLRPEVQSSTFRLCLGGADKLKRELQTTRAAQRCYRLAAVLASLSHEGWLSQDFTASMAALSLEGKTK